MDILCMTFAAACLSWPMSAAQVESPHEHSVERQMREDEDRINRILKGDEDGALRGFLDLRPTRSDIVLDAYERLYGIRPAGIVLAWPGEPRRSWVAALGKLPTQPDWQVFQADVTGLALAMPNSARWKSVAAQPLLVCLKDGRDRGDATRRLVTCALLNHLGACHVSPDVEDHQARIVPEMARSLMSLATSRNPIEMHGRGSAMLLLGAMHGSGPQELEAATVLMELARSSDFEVFPIALRALWRLDPGNAFVLQRLRDFHTATDERAREALVDLYADLGSDHAEIVVNGHRQSALASPQACGRVRWPVWRRSFDLSPGLLFVAEGSLPDELSVMIRFRREDILRHRHVGQFVRFCAEHPHPYVWRAAVELLADPRVSAADVEHAGRVLMRDATADMRCRAAAMCRRRGVAAKEADATFEAMLRPTAFVSHKRLACAELTQLKTVPPADFDRVRNLFDTDADRLVKIESAGVLWVHGRNEAAKQRLLKSVDDPRSPTARCLALRRLTSVGAMPEMVKLLNRIAAESKCEWLKEEAAALLRGEVE